VIFVTAFQEYALKAFRFSALDYLLKPVDSDELIDAVDKARKQIDPEFKIQYKNALNSFSSKDYDKIVLKDAENIFLVELSDISYCSADGNYTRVHLKSDKPILISKPIKDYEALLKESGFFRIHRSYLINLKHFKRYEKSEGGKVYLSDNTEIPVASGRKEELFEFIEGFKK
jgi:two-component system LytT family response regulator